MVNRIKVTEFVERKIGIIVFSPKQLGWGGEFSCGPVAVLNLKCYLYETYD